MKTIINLLIAGLLITGTASTYAQDKKPSTPPGKAKAKEAVEKAKKGGEDAAEKAKKGGEKAKEEAGEAEEKMKEAGQNAKKPASPPAKAEGTIDGVKVMVMYSSPSARGRKIMGELVPYKKVWRTGANATTSILFTGDVKIGDKKVPQGKYGLYTIPGETEWTIIINKAIKWGADDYSESDDVARITVPVSKTDAFVEAFTISVEKDQVVLKWENTKVAFKVAKG